MTKTNGGFNLNILIYDDENFEYMTGELIGITKEPILMDCTSIRDFMQRYMPTGRANLWFEIQDCENKETIHFDDTLMKRIAKYNKEADIEKLDNDLKTKKKKIKELEEKIEDREQRWQKIQKFVANIYDLPLEDNEDDYYDEDY